jgi:hypothetical protein
MDSRRYYEITCIDYDDREIVYTGTYTAIELKQVLDQYRRCYKAVIYA